MKTSRERLVGRTPIEVAQDLVESLASEVESEQAQELENEVEDRLAVMWGRTALSDRLWSAKGRVVRLHIAHPPAQSTMCGHVGSATLEGRVVDLGPDWLVLTPSLVDDLGPHLVVSLAKVLGMHGAPEIAGRPIKQSKIWDRRRLTQLLRPLVDSAQLVQIHSEFGCFAARVLRVAADHIDCELSKAPNLHSREQWRTVSVAFSALSYIEARLD